MCLAFPNNSICCFLDLIVLHPTGEGCWSHRAELLEDRPEGLSAGAAQWRARLSRLGEIEERQHLCVG
jgi:hypothetical protein